MFVDVILYWIIFDNQKLRLFLDSGVKLSYLSNKIICNYETVVDFYTVIGKFETGCYEISTILVFANLL